MKWNHKFNALNFEGIGGRLNFEPSSKLGVAIKPNFGLIAKRGSRFVTGYRGILFPERQQSPTLGAVLLNAKVRSVKFAF